MKVPVNKISRTICLYGTFLFLSSFAINSFGERKEKNEVYDSVIDSVSEYLGTILGDSLCLKDNNETLDSLLVEKSNMFHAAFFLQYGKRMLRKKCLHKHVYEAFRKSIYYFNLCNCKKGLGDCYFEKGLLAIDDKNAASVLLEFKKSASYYEQINYIRGQIYSFLQLAIYFSKNKNNKEASRYYDRSLQLLEHSQDEELKRIVYTNLASYYVATNEYDKALKYYNSLLNNRDIKKNIKGYGRLLNNLGLAYWRTDKYDLAKKYLIESLKIKNEANDTTLIFSTMQNLFFVAIKTGDLKLADHYYFKIKSLLNRNEDISSNTVEFLRNSIWYFMLKKKYSSAKEVLNEYITIKDSMQNAAFSDKLIEMEKSFAIQEKDRQIELLKKQDELSTATLKNQQLIILSVSGFTFLLFIVIFLVNHNRMNLKKSQKELHQKQGEIEKMNQELGLSNQAKDRLLSVIGHDLRGPLGGFKSLLELYMELPDLSMEDIKQFLVAARESSTSTYHLLENLLSWANSQKGEIEFLPEKLRVYPIASQTIELLDNSMNTRNIRLALDMDEELEVYADSNMLNIVIRNLVSNAIKYSPDNCSITLSAKEKEDCVEFCVKDEGVGMSKIEAEGLFAKKETFYLENHANSKGTGLGLILCKEFVDTHCGKIWVESKEGKGTRVYFTLPQNGSQVNQTVDVIEHQES